ncbi:MAG: MATE family efflux transporter [Suipraeoptans sp.]
MTKDLTKGSPAKLILTFTILLLIGNIFQQLYSMVDTLIVGRTLGVNSLAAVGSTGSITFFILGFVQGLTAGLAIVVAHRFGAKDTKGLRKSVGTCIWISAVSTIVLTILSVVFVRQILELLRTPSEILEEAHSYIIIILYGTFANVLFNLLSNIIRALGDSKTPLKYLMVACVVNIVLDFVFIIIMKMGVAGAAWATIISQFISGALCVLYVKRNLPIMHLDKDDLRPNKLEMARHAKIAFPMGFQISIIAIGAVILQFVLNGLGAVSVAAFTAAQKIDQIAVQPMNSFGTTMATYSAQNYGAGKIDRIKQGVRQCSLISVGFAIVMGLINVFLGYKLAGLFVGSGETEVLGLADIYLKINGVLYSVLALLFIFRFTIQGLGRSVMPTIAGIMELVMRTGAALILTGILGFAGAAMASPLAWIGACVVVFIDYMLVMKKLSIPKVE